MLPAPVEVTGPATIFKATDIWSGAPVLLTLIPVETIPDPQTRAKFEADARSIAQFDHVHVARTVDFGQEDDEYAFVSRISREGKQRSKGSPNMGACRRRRFYESLFKSSARWGGCFPADCPWRHQAFNIVITPGQVSEGGWRSIKLVNLAIGGLGIAGADFANFASPEQLGGGGPDFRSEIYSLGATMCFLLTGAFYSAEPRSLQTRRFARPLRKLIEPMLRQDPNERPQDPVGISESLPAGLEAVERRQRLSRRLGIPFLAVDTRSVRVKPPDAFAEANFRADGRGNFAGERSGGTLDSGRSPVVSGFRYRCRAFVRPGHYRRRCRSGAAYVFRSREYDEVRGDWRPDRCFTAGFGSWGR